MNPIGILNNDMSTFLLASNQLFELWNDTVSDGLKNNCVERIKQDWNTYLNEINLRMNIFMRAEKSIDGFFENFKRGIPI